MSTAECCPRPVLAVAGADHDLVDPVNGQGKNQGLRIERYHDGTEALLGIGMSPPHALLVAPDLPLVTPHELIRAVRRHWDFPIIVGFDTHNADEATRSLEAGATACIPRPYRWDDLGPLLRGSTHPIRDTTNELSFGDFVLDRCAYTAAYRGDELQLSMREFELLDYLIEQQGHVVSRDQISEAVWNGPTATNTVVVHIRRLRRKIGDDPKDGAIIRNVRGAGYRLEQGQ